MNPVISDPATVRAELLDCIQANLAVLADHRHGPGTHLAMGAVLRFRPLPGDGGLPTVEPPLAPQLAEAGRRLGLYTVAEYANVAPDGIRALAAEHGRLYVVADSAAMPWLPYYRRRHMEHSYLVEPSGPAAMVTDAYHNQTPWGTAAPGRWHLAWDELPPDATVRVLAADPAGPPSAAPAADLAPPGDYPRAYAEHPDRTAATERFAVETWLLARSRKLHHAFRERTGTPHAGLTAQLERWDALAGRAFVALRRVARGHPEPSGLFTELEHLLTDEAGAARPRTDPAP
ncbi:hypothetical protein [Catenuloplanes indicus]|uniref:Uncharacterized protein n=1 Tax=Catenuloplanes indicus TaxID=137267 RepID=A0AAE3VVQ7_9ACTN|nr:hypothetical protein [Catenuloplanes indicus]MDQ0364913.1 hypothetical protein [Catenuloplanes indicus]